MSQEPLPQDPIASTPTPMPSAQNNDNGESVGNSTAEVVPKPNKKLKSSVWNDFTREKLPNNVVEATCNYCKKVFNGHSGNGTSHLKNHLKSCVYFKRTSKDISQSFLGKSLASGGPLPTLSNHKFEPDVERALYAKMVAKHDFPFLMCQYPYFRHWISYIMPTYKFRTRNTVRNDLMGVYVEEKSRIYAEIEKLSSRVTLTTDGWKPKHQNRGYFCITCHYIDDNWVLHKRIISFHVVQYPHHGALLSEWLKGRILDWNIDKKMFSIVVDNASNNSGMLEGIKGWLNSKNALLHGGDMFHLRCCAHIINLIVKNGLDVVQGLIEKIRKSVLYINHSPKRNEQFERALIQNRLNPKKRVSLDVETRWNSTYDMINDALGCRVAFERLAELDCEYKLLPSNEEWEKGKKICECLKLFSDVTKRFSGTKYPTANFYFFEIWKIRVKLGEWKLSNVDYIAEMTSLMNIKFEKYWEECNMVLTIAAILDPRYKMKVVECVYTQVYGECALFYINKVRDFMFELFSEYAGPSTSNTRDVGESSSYKNVDMHCGDDEFVGMFNSFISQTRSSTIARKNDLEQYLEEGLEILNAGEVFTYDVLEWWRRNGPKFSILAKMAQDILAIPASSVASESAFSQARRILSDTRSSLNSETVEALTCTKDWLPLLENERKTSFILFILIILHNTYTYILSFDHF